MDRFEKDNLTGHHHSRSSEHDNSDGRFLTASTVIGDKVFNTDGKDMGRIKDIMLDLEMGTLDYFVIEFGGFLGIGEKFFAIPVSMLKVDPERKAFVTDIKRETLERAPGFDKNHWPDSNSRHVDDSKAYWGDFMGSSTG